MPYISRVVYTITVLIPRANINLIAKRVKLEEDAWVHDPQYKTWLEDPSYNRRYEREIKREMYVEYIRELYATMPTPWKVYAMIHQVVTMLE